MGIMVRVREGIHCHDKLHTLCNPKLMQGMGGLKWLFICSCKCHLPEPHKSMAENIHVEGNTLPRN